MKPSERSELKVVLDTQILLRGAVAKGRSLTGRIYDAWRGGQFVLLISEPILAEIEAVLRRPALLQKLHLGTIEARALVALLRRSAVLVRPITRVQRSRDPADDKFLECAVSGGADYLVSGDADLLTIREIQGIPILDAPAFWRKLMEQSGAVPDQ